MVPPWFGHSVLWCFRGESMIYLWWAYGVTMVGLSCLHVSSAVGAWGCRCGSMVGPLVVHGNSLFCL